MIIDFIIKLVNYYKVQKANTMPTLINKNDNPLYLDEPLVFDPIKLYGGEYVVKGNLIIMDAVLIIAIFFCYFYQMSMAKNNTLTYLHIGILLSTRAYMKLPFALVLC